MATTITQAVSNAASYAAATAQTNFDNFGSFSGAQITATINHVQIGTIAAINWSIHTEKAAQYTFGSPNPRRFTTGKRGIAGSLIFNTFDRSALLAVFAGSNNIGQSILANMTSNTNFSDLASPFLTASPSSIGGNIAQVVNSGIAANFTSTSNQQFNTYVQQDLQDAYANAFLTPLYYSDQLPPFDVTLTMVDSVGQGAYMAILGLEIVSEGGGFNIDDMINQTAYTFVARSLRPLTPVSAGGSPIPQYTIPATPTSLLSSAGSFNA